MRNTNIFVAFSNKKVAVSVAKIAAGIGLNVVCIANSLAELKKYVHAYQNGVIVCGFRFNDDYILEFVEDVPENVSVVMVAKKHQLDECDNERVFKLAVPLQKVDLVCSLNMLATMEECAHLGVSRKPEEEKLIKDAKRTLILRYDFTEDQAHRYMQKKSMDTGRKLVDIAKIVLSD